MKSEFFSALVYSLQNGLFRIVFFDEYNIFVRNGIHSQAVYNLGWMGVVVVVVWFRKCFNTAFF